MILTLTLTLPLSRHEEAFEKGNGNYSVGAYVIIRGVQHQIIRQLSAADVIIGY